MSGGIACKCEESKKPINERAWSVHQRNCNHSAFNGYRRTYSDYSGVFCDRCGTYWRTKAAYVDKLKDGVYA